MLMLRILALGLIGFLRLTDTSVRSDHAVWFDAGSMIVAMKQAQPITCDMFLKSVYMRKFTSSAFGVMWHNICLTGRPNGSLSILLLLSGDIETNPGPLPHEKSEENQKPFSCAECLSNFTERKSLLRHTRSVHGSNAFICEICNKKVNRNDNLKRHLLTHRNQEPDKKKNKLSQNIKDGVLSVMNKLIDRVVTRVNKPVESALNGRYRVIEIPAEEQKDPGPFLESLRSRVNDFCSDALSSHKGIKLQICLIVDFYKPLEPKIEKTGYFWSNQLIILPESEISFDEIFGKILKKIDSFQREGSGWAIHRIQMAEVHVVKYAPLRGSTYTRLPKKLISKRSIINIKNKDNMCFVWSVLAALFPTDKNPNRVSKYRKHLSKVTLDGLVFPMSVKDIDRFEKMNNISVNVYGYHNGLYPLRISKGLGQTWIHMLLFKGHYTLIKDLNRLLFSQRKFKGRKHFCPRCLIPRTSRRLLEEHLKLCSLQEPTRVRMPNDEFIKFVNFERVIRKPLVLFADFEALLEEPLCETGGQYFRRHTPCSYGLLEVLNCCGKIEKYKSPTIYRGKDCVTKFLLDIEGIVIQYHHRLQNHKPMQDFDPEKHMSSICHICNELIEDKKVADHCHICGCYRGPAHNHCNLSLRLNRDVIVVFHNLRRYDGHMIMEHLGYHAKLQGYKIEAVAKSMEDYLSFTLKHQKMGPGDSSYRIKFIDSALFLNMSLDGLVQNLPKDEFHLMMREFNQRNLHLLLKKGVYPYDHMDDWKKFEELSLPSKEQFFNFLTKEHITSEDYQHANTIWQTFDIKNMGMYHDLYLMTDVILLADVFEQFRRFSLKTYGLDPCHYITTPALAWDACLKVTKVRLECLKDPQMYIFFESGIKGGVAQIAHRWAQANNPMVDGYIASDPRSYIMYLDAVNLYGYSMCRYLPIGFFRWLHGILLQSPKKMVEYLLNLPEDQGVILEVDLSYPERLHDAHSDYPLAPELMKIKQLSPYCEHLLDLMGYEPPRVQKLIPNLYPKKNYIIHYQTLLLYLSYGLELDKIHNALQFTQKKWLAPYIEMNAALRKVANSAFDRDLLKLFNNAVYGKTLQNPRKYNNVELVTSGLRFEKLVANPRYRNSRIFNQNLIGVCIKKPSTLLDKPIYCGFSVLELSKKLMYEFHYGYIKEKYGEHAQLLFTDTDSLCYLIQTHDVYQDMREDANHFDFSNYPESHPNYSTLNKKVLGKFTDETAGVPIMEFCGLRAKMYSILCVGSHKKRAKGIKRSVVKNEIYHEDYVDTLKCEDSMQHEITKIESKRHRIYTTTSLKKSLSAYDDKRFLLDNVNSRAYGHFRDQ